MYTFFKRLLIEILTSIMANQADKLGERESLNDEEIVKKYGEETLIFKSANVKSTLTSYAFLNAVLVFCVIVSIIVIIALRIFVPEQFNWKITAILLVYIPIFMLSKTFKTIYATKRDIITKEKVIMRRAYREDRIVTYDEIKQATKSKKIKIKKAIVYIPTSSEYIQIPMVDVKGDLAIAKIRLRSKIYIPEFTENRKKYMGQASTCGLYNFFGLLMGLMSLCLAGSVSIDKGEEYYKILFTFFPINLFLLISFGLFGIGKLIFVLGQYKLKKDINDPERVTIKVF